MQPILLLQNIDSTLVRLDNKSREHNQKMKQSRWSDFVWGSCQTKWQYLECSCHDDSDKITFFEKYIVKLKAADEIKRVLEEKQNKNKKT
jgi:hypothetical protein